MNRSIKTVSLFAALSLAATGCQKETVEDFAISEVSTVYTVLYSIDGVQHQIILNSEEEHRAFILEMLALTRQGHVVVFCEDDNMSQGPGTKDVVYFSSPDPTEVAAWTVQMEKAGYNVRVTYDDKTGMYNCVAWN